MAEISLRPSISLSLFGLFPLAGSSPQSSLVGSSLRQSLRRSSSQGQSMPPFGKFGSFSFVTSSLSSLSEQGQKNVFKAYNQFGRMTFLASRFSDQVALLELVFIPTQRERIGFHLGVDIGTVSTPVLLAAAHLDQCYLWKDAPEALTQFFQGVMANAGGFHSSKAMNTLCRFTSQVVFSNIDCLRAVVSVNFPAREEPFVLCSVPAMLDRMDLVSTCSTLGIEFLEIFPSVDLTGTLSTKIIACEQQLKSILSNQLGLSRQLKALKKNLRTLKEGSVARQDCETLIEENDRDRKALQKTCESLRTQIAESRDAVEALVTQSFSTALDAAAVKLLGGDYRTVKTALDSNGIDIAVILQYASFLNNGIRFGVTPSEVAFKRFISEVADGTFIPQRYEKSIFLKEFDPDLVESWKDTSGRTQVGELLDGWPETVARPSESQMEWTIGRSDRPKDFVEMGSMGHSCQSLTSGGEMSLGWGEIPYDGQNQLVAIYDKSGKMVGRAILRLVKTEGGEPALFVEPLYTSHTPQDVLQEMIYRGAIREAKSLGLPLYTQIKWKEVEAKPLPLYSRTNIAPKQYVDSGGMEGRPGSRNPYRLIEGNREVVIAGDICLYKH